VSRVEREGEFIATREELGKARSEAGACDGPERSEGTQPGGCAAKRHEKAQKREKEKEGEEGEFIATKRHQPSHKATAWQAKSHEKGERGDLNGRERRGSLEG
jgi:hypothetical protein